MTGSRVDSELVARGFARSRAHARQLVAAGRVRLNGHVIVKPAALVDAGVVLEVEPDPADPGYVSRAAHKLAGALEAFGAAPLVQDAACLDVGASTGGFTDVLLRYGASTVLAVDVGHGQLDPRLRTDPRVTVREGFNVRDIASADVPDGVSLVVADLSFISLRLVLAPLADAVPYADFLLMVKPQFEVGRERLGRGGVVRDPALHIETVEAVCADARALGLSTHGIVASALPGPSGNREFFCWFRPDDDDSGQEDVSGAVRAAVADPRRGQVAAMVSSASKVAWTGQQHGTQSLDASERTSEGGAR